MQNNSTLNISDIFIVAPCILETIYHTPTNAL